MLRPQGAEPETVASITKAPVTDMVALGQQQKTCPEIQELASAPNLVIRRVPIEGASVLCDYSTGKPDHWSQRNAAEGFSPLYITWLIQASEQPPNIHPVCLARVVEGRQHLDKSLPGLPERENNAPRKSKSISNPHSNPTFQPHTHRHCGPIATLSWIYTPTHHH